MNGASAFAQTYTSYGLATVRYPNWPGLVRGKKVYFVLARGGVYTQGPMQQLNFQGQRLYKERFLRHDSHLDTAPSERLRHHRQFSADVFGSHEECKSWAS